MMWMVPPRVEKPTWQPGCQILWSEFSTLGWPLPRKAQALGTKLPKANSVQTREDSREQVTTSSSLQGSLQMGREGDQRGTRVGLWLKPMIESGRENYFSLVKELIFFKLKWLQITNISALYLTHPTQPWIGSATLSLQSHFLASFFLSFLPSLMAWDTREPMAFPKASLMGSTPGGCSRTLWGRAGYLCHGNVPTGHRV